MVLYMVCRTIRIRWNSKIVLALHNTDKPDGQTVSCGVCWGRRRWGKMKSVKIFQEAFREIIQNDMRKMIQNSHTCTQINEEWN